MSEKVCTVCGEMLPLSKFYAYRSGPSAGKTIAQCKPCNLAKQRERYKGRSLASPVAPRKYIQGSTAERLAAYSKRVGDCLVFTGSINPRGYGSFTTSEKTRHAHRVAYELAHGEIPAGLEIDHICHNRACIEPAHLRATTHKQNMENYAGPPSSNTSGVRGVYWAKSQQKWVAAVTHAGKRYHVGYFDDLDIAARAVLLKRNELHTHNITDRDGHDRN